MNRHEGSLPRHEATSARLQVILLAAGGLLALVLAWRRLLIDGLVPVDGNVLCVTYPNWKLARGLWLDPRLPLWNNLRNMGAPFLADPIAMVLYPVQWVLAALPTYLEFTRAWVVLHSLLAAVATGALARRWCGPSWPGTCAAALIGTFNALFMVRVVFPHNFASAAWLPAVLYFQAAGSVPGTAAAFALQWLAGYPSFSVLTALCGLGFALLEGQDAVKRLALSGAAALALCAAQFLPFLEYLRHSSRGVMLTPEGAAQFSIPPAQLLKSVLVPQWHLLRPAMEGDPAMVCFYVGLVALGLAAWGAARGGRRERWVAAACAALLVVSLGRHLPGYRFLYPLHFFRFPNNWLLPVPTGIALLAASGLARVRKPAWAWALAGALAADLLVFAQAPKSAWARPEFLTDTPALAARARALPPFSRILHTEPLMRLWSSGTLETEEDYLLMKDYLAPSYGMAFGVEEVTNYQTMQPALSRDYRRRLADPASAASAADLAGIGLVIGVEEKAPRVERGRMRVETNPDALSRVFIPDSGGPPSRTGSVEILSYRPGRIEARLKTDKDAAAVFSETRYPGWTASLDGRPVPHRPYAGAFMLVDVPAGEHKLVFEYGSRWFWVGLAISIAGLAFLALGCRPARGKG